MEATKNNSTQEKIVKLIICYYCKTPIHGNSFKANHKDYCDVSCKKNEDFSHECYL